MIRRPSLDAAQSCTYLSPLFVMMFVALSYGATWIYFRFMFLSLPRGDIDPNRAIFNLRLVQLLYVAVAVWIVLLNRRLITSNSGRGLVLASFGLQARLLSEFARDGTEFIRDQTGYTVYPPDVPVMFLEMAGTAYERQVALVSYVGIAAFAIGLISMSAVVITELRARSGVGRVPHRT